jgi:hypothetical protein
MNQKKIIFLDIDGVLNHHLFYVAEKEAGRIGQRDTDPKSVEYLNTLCNETGAEVVVSSTWRLGRTTEQLQELLKEAGFTGKVIGRTEDLRYGKGGESILRGNEILHWIKENTKLIGAEYWQYKSYVILDDDSDMLYWQKDNFILVDHYCGITPSTIFQAKKILGAKLTIAAIP